MPITIFEHLEDFDNNEISVLLWQEIMEEQVMVYNKEYDTSYDPTKTVDQYINRKYHHDE